MKLCLQSPPRANDDPTNLTPPQVVPESTLPSFQAASIRLFCSGSLCLSDLVCFQSHKRIRLHLSSFLRPLSPVLFQAASISACGNFAVIGTANGRIDRFNLQSGIHRGSYSETKAQFSSAHEGAVVGLECDSSNSMLISGGYDGRIKVGPLSLHVLAHEMGLTPFCFSTSKPAESSSLGFHMICMWAETQHLISKQAYQVV
jgi:hypothetical protein